MKKLVALVLLFISINVYSQTALDAVLQGTVINAKSNFIELKYVNNPLDDTLSSIKIELNEKGQFYFELPIKRPLDANLVHNNQSAPLYIEPSERIEVSILADDVFRSINYASNNFNNHYLIAYQKKYERPRNKDERKKHIQNNDALTYAKYENELAEDKLNFLSQYHAENNLSTIFIKRQEASINYGAANYKYKLKDALKDLNITTKQIPDYYYSFMLELPVDENDLITVPEFYEYLEHRFQYKFITTPYKATNELETVSYTFNIAHSLYKDRVQNIYLTKKFGELLDTYSYENTSRFISSYMSTVYQKEYRIYIDKKLEKARLRN